MTDENTPPTDNTLATLAADHGPDLATAPFTWKTLHAISRTDFVPKELRGNPAAILACVMYGREWGLGPMESLQLIDMIDGSPSPAAQLLVAKVFAAGHEMYPKSITAEGATAVLVRHNPDGGTREYEYTFTMDDARRAGLAGKTNFKTYPGPMCYWRAAGQLIRFAAPDVLGPGRGYSPDELGSDTWVPPEAAIVYEPAEARTADEAQEVEAWEAAELVDGQAETAEILADPDTVAAIAEAEDDLATGRTVTLEELGGQVVEKPPEDYEQKLVGFVTGWLGGDEAAARMEVARVIRGRKMTQKLANDLYASLRKRLDKHPSGQAELL